MPGYNGSGQFIRSFNWTQDAGNAIPIMASRFDTENDGFAAGLSNVICRDGQSTVTADIPWNNHKLTGVANAVAAQDAINLQTGDVRYLPARLRKTADTSRSVTTYADDPDLILPLLASTSYTFKLYLPIGSSYSGIGVNPGIKLQLAYSGTITNINYAGYGNINSAFISSINASSVGSTIISNNVSGFSILDWIVIDGSIITNASGNLSLQWAQVTANNTTSVKAGAYIVAFKLA